MSAWILQFAHRNRLLAKRAIALLDRVLPRPLARRLRQMAELAAFRMAPQYQGDTLPPIFHFWSERYIRPVLQARGFESPEDFYLKKLVAEAARVQGPLRIASIGAGACALEVELAAALQARGLDFAFTCIDINAGLLQAGARAAKAAGVDGLMRFQAAGAGTALASMQADVVIANQILHHVEDLEDTIAAAAACLRDGGVLLTSDIVGRNGHLPWPSVERVIQARWSELPREKRFDRFSNSAPERYRPENHAAYSNEGVRAQDITRILHEHMDFELFLTFAGSIVPFVERRIGFNFDPDSEDDRGFIERVASEDQAALAQGRYPGSNMLAALRVRGAAAACDFHPVPPQRHVELVAAEAATA